MVINYCDKLEFFNCSLSVLPCRSNVCGASKLRSVYTLCVVCIAYCNYSFKRFKYFQLATILLEKLHFKFILWIRNDSKLFLQISHENTVHIWGV